MSRFRTGFEELVAHRTRPPFAYPAEDDGIIQSIDQDAGVLVVKYKNGTKSCVKFGEEYTNNTSNGFYVNQAVVINGFKVGDKVKKGDIITYNKEFFQADPYSKSTVRFKTGIQTKVAIVDAGCTIEDACCISQSLAEKMEFNPVHVNQIVVTKDTNIRAFVKIGETVNSVDPIIVFDESAFDAGDEDDPELIEMLSKMNQTAPKAGHTGQVVQIDVLYKSPVSSMTPTLQKLIKYAVEKKNAQAVAAEGCENTLDFMKSAPLTATTKIGLVDLTPETVIIRFYIKQNKSMGAGDKMIFGHQLKSVVSKVMSEPIRTEDGTEVEALTSGRGIMQRILLSPGLMGTANAVLEKLEKDVLDMWFSPSK